MRKLIVLLAVLAALVVAAPASAYLHVANCQGGLRYSYYPGDMVGDNDIHNWGVRNGISSFNGWANSVRLGDGQVYAYFYWSKNGVSGTWHGYCSGSDSSFTDNVPNW